MRQRHTHLAAIYVWDTYAGDNPKYICCWVYAYWFAQIVEIHVRQTLISYINGKSRVFDAVFSFSVSEVVPLRPKEL